MRSLPILAALFLSLLTAQGAAAASPDLDAAAIPYVTVETGDDNGDGRPDPSVQVLTPPCGCNCPVVGGGADLQAAGQDGRVVGATSGCQHYAYVGTASGPVDPLGPVVVDPFTIFYGGGLDPTLDRLGQSIAA